MRQVILTVCIMFCLLFPSNLVAVTPNPDQAVVSPLSITLSKYRERGYDVLGPVQYLGKDDGRIHLYRHATVSYKRLDIFNEIGKAWLVRKYNFVYILSKDDHVVIIRLKRKERNDV